MKLVSIAERKQFRICKNTKMQKGAKSIFPIDKENAHILQRKTKVGSPGIGAALPLHSPSAMGRQKKWPPITAAIYPCIKLCLQYRVMTRFSGQPLNASFATRQPFGMEMLVRLEQSRKAPSPISVTDGGIEILVRLLQPEKALCPISVTDEGMEMLVRLEQPKKALCPISVTDGGMEILVRLEQPKKAPSPIPVTDGGMIVFLQPHISVLLSE